MYGHTDALAAHPLLSAEWERLSADVAEVAALCERAAERGE